MGNISLKALFVLTLLIYSSAVAALTADSVEKCKKATALVEIAPNSRERVFGSAFCIDASGLFVTNAHVADPAAGGTIKLILSPGESDQRIVNAALLRSDPQLDLAVLQIPPPAGLSALELGHAAALYDTMEITAFGYPFGSGLALDAKEYPAISVNTGRVTSLRKKGGELELIQLDAALNPGNSGGPVVDGAGHVIGIVEAGVRGAGINFAIPVSRLEKLLAKPLIAFTPAEIPYVERSLPHKLTVQLTSMARPVPKYSVELSIRVLGQPSRVYSAQTVGGSCTFSVVAVPAETGNKRVLMIARFSQGSISGKVIDRAVKVGATMIRLDEIRQIERKPGSAEATVTTGDARTLVGRILGLDSVALSMGESAATVDMSRAPSITVEDADRPVKSFAYAVAVSADGRHVGDAAGVITFSGAPADAVEMAAATPAAGSGSTDAPPPAGPIMPIGNSPVQPAPPIPHVLDVMGSHRLTPGSGVSNTPIAGSPGDPTWFTRDNPQHHDIRGFRFELGNWDRRPIIHILDPLYDTFDQGQPNVVVAKEGYVVGGLIADTSDHVHAICVIFVREQNGQINPADRYFSKWIGTAASGTLPKQFAGHGEHVVGLCGRKGMNVDAIGLMIMP